MRAWRQTVSGIGVSTPIIPDWHTSVVNIGVGVKISATATFTVEHTFDDVFSPTFDPATATWYPNSGLTAQTTNKDGNYAYPISAFRLNVSASTGTATIQAIQAGIIS
jgi:hypothetical protein